MRFLSTASLIGVCTLISACGSISWDSKRFFVVPGVETAPPYNWTCKANQDRAAKAAKWEDAVTVVEAIKDDIYQSGLLSLKVGVPHIIKVTNLDKQARWFRAPGLFAKSSVLKIVHEGIDVVVSCPQAIAVAPQKTSQIHLIPLERGYFDYHETLLSTPMLTELTTMGSVGVAHVY